MNRRQLLLPGAALVGAGLASGSVAVAHASRRQAFGGAINAEALAKHPVIPQDAILYADFQNDVYYVGGAVFSDRTQLPGWTRAAVPIGAIGKMAGYTFPSEGTVYAEWLSNDPLDSCKAAFSSYDGSNAILWSSTLGSDGAVGMRTLVGGKTTDYPAGKTRQDGGIVRHVVAYTASAQCQATNAAPSVATAAATAPNTSELRFGYYDSETVLGAALSKVIVWNKQLSQARITQGATTGLFPGGVALGSVVRPEDFAADAGRGFDDRRAIQAAMDFVGARRFGKVQLAAPKIYKVQSRSSFRTDGGRNKAALIVRFDNITVDIQPGSKLYLNATAPTQLFYRSGIAKKRGVSILPTPRDSRNYAGTFNSISSTWELVKIRPAAIGNESVRLHTPSDARKFRVGDWVLLRAGNTLAATEPNSYDTPFGQYSKVRAIDAVAGVISFDRAMVWPIKSHLYPAGHNSAGREIPWGLINLSYPIDAFIDGFSLTGAVEMRGSASHAVIVGNFTAYNRLGTAARPLVIETDGNCFSMGQSRSSAVVRIPECGSLMTKGQTCWVASNDACNHEMTWKVSAVGRSMYIHTHEGTTGFDIAASLIATAQWHEEAGFRAYAKNGRFNLNLRGIGRGWAGVYLDGSTTSITGSVIGRGASVTSEREVCGNVGVNNRVTVSLGSDLKE